MSYLRDEVYHWAVRNLNEVQYYYFCEWCERMGYGAPELMDDDGLGDALFHWAIYEGNCCLPDSWNELDYVRRYNDSESTKAPWEAREADEDEDEEEDEEDEEED